MVERRYIKQGKIVGRKNRRLIRLYTHNCGWCNRLFEMKATSYEYKKRKNHFCSDSCFSKYQQNLRKGKTHEEIFGKEKAKVLMAKFRKTAKGMNSGEKNPAWKGGICPIHLIIRSSYEYTEWRLMVFGRDDYTCQECRIRGTYLEAHHIIPFIRILEKYNIKTMEESINCEELWDINNGITLCKRCHNKTKRGVAT